MTTIRKSGDLILVVSSGTTIRFPFKTNPLAVLLQEIARMHSLKTTPSLKTKEL